MWWFWILLNCDFFFSGGKDENRYVSVFLWNIDNRTFYCRCHFQFSHVQSRAGVLPHEHWHWRGILTALPSKLLRLIGLPVAGYLVKMLDPPSVSERRSRGWARLKPEPGTLPWSHMGCRGLSTLAHYLLPSRVTLTENCIESKTAMFQMEFLWRKPASQTVF